jgi:multidrug efflux pump subunit AcrA (membrane-fusion protein)
VARRASRKLRLRRQVAAIVYVARCTGLAPFAPGGVAAPGRPGPAPPVAVLPARPAPAPSAVPARPVAPSAVPAPPVPAPATPAPAPGRKHR